MESSTVRGRITSATCFVVMLSSAFEPDSALPTMCTRARACLRRAISCLGSPGRLTVGRYPSPQQLDLDARARGQLSLARRHPREGVRAEHGGEDVRALLLRRLGVPAVVAQRQTAADGL